MAIFGYLTFFQVSREQGQWEVAVPICRGIFGSDRKTAACTLLCAASPTRGSNFSPWSFHSPGSSPLHLQDVCDDLLLNYDDGDHVITAGRIGLIATLLFSFPLLTHPCRETVRFPGFWLWPLLFPKSQILCLLHTC